MALRWPSEWLTRPVRWILFLAVGLHALGALSGWLGEDVPAFLQVLPRPESLFEPVASPDHRVAGAALFAALVVLTMFHWMLGRLLPWVVWLQLGALTWVTIRAGAPAAPLWTAAWLLVGIVCLGVVVPAVRRAVMLRRWAERATGWSFLDAGAVEESGGAGWQRVPLVAGLVLLGACVLWNGAARLFSGARSDWPPSLLGDLAPWGLGLLGLCLVVVDVGRALLGALQRHAIPPMVIEFSTTGPGPLDARMDNRWLAVEELQNLPECNCEAEYRRRESEDEDETLSWVSPDRRCPHHGHRRVNELTPAEFLAVAGQGWLWAAEAGVWPEDLADFRDHPGRVFGFGFEGLGGRLARPSLTEEHRRHDIRFVEQDRFSLLRRHPPAPRRPTLRLASRGEVIDTIDLAPVGIAGVAVRTPGEYPTFVPSQRAGERASG